MSTRECLSRRMYRLCTTAMVVTTIAGCYGPPLVPSPPSTAANRTEVVFVRPEAANAAMLPIAIGFDKGTLVVLRNAEYALVALPASRYKFFVQVQTTPLHGLPPETTHLELQIAPAERTCIMALADPQNALRAAVPGLYIVMGPRFSLQTAPCPSPSDLARYRQVTVSSPSP